MFFQGNGSHRSITKPNGFSEGHFTATLVACGGGGGAGPVETATQTNLVEGRNCPDSPDQANEGFIKNLASDLDACHALNANLLSC